jgi:hypothetical protein
MVVNPLTGVATSIAWMTYLGFSGSREFDVYTTLTNPTHVRGIVIDAAE